MDRAGWNYPAGDFRVSDADRDRALAELGEAHRVGRLTADELDERAGRAVAARTGSELAALLADLPAEAVLAVRPLAPDRDSRTFASRTSLTAALAAICCAAIAVGNALSRGPGPAERAAIRRMVIHAGVPVSAKFPPSPGFDWGGTITPAIIAVLLVVLIICLRVRRNGAAGS